MPITLPDINKVLPGMPEQRDPPRIDRQLLPNKQGGKDGFESFEVTTHYHDHDDPRRLTSRREEITHFIKIDQHGKETKTSSHARVSVTIDARLNIVQEIEPGKETITIGQGSAGGNSYVYEMKHGVASFKETTMAGAATTLTEKQLFDKIGASGAAKDYLALLRTAINKAGTPATGIASAALVDSAPSPHTLSSTATTSSSTRQSPKPVPEKLRDGGTLWIRTDGHSTTVQGPMDSTANSYHNQKAENKNPVSERKFSPDAYYGGANNLQLIDNFMKDKKLADSLPLAVREQIAAAIHAGVIVLVEHSTEPLVTAHTPKGKTTDKAAQHTP